MAITVNPTNLEQMEFDVTTAEGPCRVTVVTGNLPAGAQAFSSSETVVTQSTSVNALVDPTLTPGQFRKATATAAFASISANANAVPHSFQVSIDQVDATFDGQSGRTEIRVDVTLSVANGLASIQGIRFQVTTLAKL